MAKFCVYCGRALQEGEICHCRSVAQQAVPSKTEGAVAAAIVSASKAGGYLRTLWDLVKKSFRAPARMLRSFAASGDAKAALGLVGAQAILFALFMDVLCSRITASFLGAVKGASSTLGALFGSSFSSLENSEEFQSLFQFPLGKIFFLSLVLAVAAAFLFAGLLLLFSKAFKSRTTYRHMLCVSGANSLAAAPFLLVGILGLLINIRLGIGIVCLGFLLQPYFTFEALNGTAAVEEDKSVYVCFLSFAVLTLVMLFVAKQIYPQYLPTELKSTLDGLKSHTDDASSLLSSLFGRSFSN